MGQPKQDGILRKQTNWENLYFYQKTCAIKYHVGKGYYVEGLDGIAMTTAERDTLKTSEAVFLTSFAKAVIKCLSEYERMPH